VALFSMPGCATRAAHYGSMVDLRDATSTNYAQQVLNAIVGIRDRGELPAFFYIEGSAASWSPNVSGSLAGQVLLGFAGALHLPAFSGNAVTISPGASGGITLNDSFQLNDFGPAALSRVTALYGFLMAPVQVGEAKLPHGALFTVIREAEEPNGFILWTKTNDGRYLGVTKETLWEFYKLTRDVFYWSRHAEPDPQELESAPGLLYAFFIQYPQTEVGLSQAIKDAAKARKAADQAQTDFSHALDNVRALEQEVRKAKGESPMVLTAILQEAYKELGLRLQAMTGAEDQNQQVSTKIQSLQNKITELFGNLQQVLLLIKSMDPAGDSIDLDAILQPLRRRVDGLLAGDPKVIAEVESQRRSGLGLSARDTVDKLYRDRFEALPERFLK
jgi:hypothetical protein